MNPDTWVSVTPLGLVLFFLWFWLVAIWARRGWFDLQPSIAVLRRKKQKREVELRKKYGLGGRDD